MSRTPGPKPASEPPIREDRSLELSAAAMRDSVERVMARLTRLHETLATQPAGYDVAHPPAAELVRRPLPERGSGDLDQLLDLVFDVALPPSFNTAGPGYLAYIPGGGIFTAAVGDLIANGINRYVAVWQAAPLLAEIEADVLRWLATILGYPAAARGLLTTGGSLATLTAVVTARHERLGEDPARAVIYVSDQGHHSIPRAAAVAGLPRQALRTLPSDESFRLRVDRLEEAIAADRAAGLRPFLVVASAGTTNTGAVDDLPALAALCRRHQLWLHVDAAYGGFFQLTERGRQRLRGIAEADSVVLDPHKGLFLPYGTGALLVRDGQALRRAHAIHADYMPTLQGEDSDRVDFCEYGPELSRGFRGLRVWLPLQLHGLEPFRINLDEKLDLARLVADRIHGQHGIEVVAPPQLSILAFRVVRPGLSDEALDALTQRVLDRVLASERVWLTSTRLRGRLAIRVCVLHFRTHRERIDECIDLLLAAAEKG